MWFLLATTSALAVLTDAGYLYNAPNVAFNLPSNRPANIQPILRSQHQHVKISQGIPDNDKTISYSISYKDYVYLKKDNIGNNYIRAHHYNPNYSNLQIHANTGAAESHTEPLGTQNIQTNARGHGYAGHAQQLPAVSSFIINQPTSYALSPANVHQQYEAPITNVNSNFGYTQATQTTGYYNQNAAHGQVSHLPSSPSYSNSYAQIPTAGVSSNARYAQTQTASANSNYNNAYSQTISPSTATVNLNNGYEQILSPTNNVNNGYLYTQTESAAHNNGYAQAASLTSAPLNNGYSHVAQVTGPSSNEYSQTVQGTTASNNGIGQALQPNTLSNNKYSLSAQTTVPLNNGYSYTTQTTASSNNGYNPAVQVSAPSNSGYDLPVQATVLSNNDHTQTSQNTAPSNNGIGQIGQTNTPLNNEYSQAVQVTAPSTNGYSYTPQTTAPSNNGYNSAVQVTAPSNNGYNDIAQSSTIQNNGYSTNQNANIGYDETLTSSHTATLNTGYEQALPSANVNSGFAPTLLSTASHSSGTGYSQVSTGPLHVDLNSGVAQTSPTAVDNSFTANSLSGGDNLSSGLGQSNVNAAVTSSPGGAAITPSVTPIVHKHIYFHVPPPEIEEPPKVLPPPPPPKKNYKILFIKVPSQDSKTNLVRLQQEIAQRQNAAIEDRTLIYVLVKNPEDPKPVVLPKLKPSEHQVFFVKYNGSPFDIASQVSDELDNTNTVKSIVPLEPGLVNGSSS